MVEIYATIWFAELILSLKHLWLIICCATIGVTREGVTSEIADNSTTTAMTENETNHCYSLQHLIHFILITSFYSVFALSPSVCMCNQWVFTRLTGSLEFLLSTEFLIRIDQTTNRLALECRGPSSILICFLLGTRI